MKLLPLTRLFGFCMAAALSLSSLDAHAADEKKPPPMTQKPAAAPQKPAACAERMDINSASEAQLATLNGIGDVRAQAIVKGRPYAGKDDLVNKKIVPQAVYDKIKDQIIARQK